MKPSSNDGAVARSRDVIGLDQARESQNGTAEARAGHLSFPCRPDRRQGERPFGNQLILIKVVDLSAIKNGWQAPNLSRPRDHDEPDVERPDRPT